MSSFDSEADMPTLFQNARSPDRYPTFPMISSRTLALT